MTESVTAPKPRLLPARRLVLLASAAGLGAALLFGGSEFVIKPHGSALNNIAYAQGLQRPVGFADIVEKVKPAVISVRVKVNSGPQMMGFDGNMPFPPGSQMERFFRRFGMPDGDGARTPQTPRQPRDRMVTGQGSGFIISADGYAVTNNHVVDKAETVEVTTDDGKTYTAKVIGTDPRTDLALIKVEGRSDFPFVKSRRQAPRASATGCSRSAIRSVSAAPSRPASCRRAAATSAPARTTTSSRSTRRSTRATPAARPSTSTAT